MVPTAERLRPAAEVPCSVPCLRRARSADCAPPVGRQGGSLAPSADPARGRGAERGQQRHPCSQRPRLEEGHLQAGGHPGVGRPSCCSVGYSGEQELLGSEQGCHLGMERGRFHEPQCALQVRFSSVSYSCQRVKFVRLGFQLFITVLFPSLPCQTCGSMIPSTRRGEWSYLVLHSSRGFDCYECRQVHGTSAGQC